MNPDPRLTAYALGELDPADRDAFERDLAASPDVQRALTETIALAEALPAALANPADALDDERRRALREKFTAPKKIFPLVRVWLPALAACLLAALALLSLLAKRDPRGIDLMKAPAIAMKSGGVKTTVRVIRDIPAPSPTPALAVVAAKKSDDHETPTQLSHTMSAPVPPAVKNQIEQQLAEGETFYQSGRYDLAFKRAEQVLAQDKFNIPARRLMEKINASRQTYADNAYNATRRRPLLQADNGWEMPVRRFAGNKDVAAAGAAELAKQEAVSTAPAAPQIYAKSGRETTVTIDRAPLTGGARMASTRFDRAMTLAETDSLSRQEALPAEPGDEAYAPLAPNAFLEARANPLSTFSIDVDTASYANVRRFLTNGQRPPADAVRLEELINYFPYALPQPAGDTPFSVTTDVTKAPWAPDHLLARIALKGRDLDAKDLPPSNLVFLVDVSGSMRPENKLPLLQRALRGLVERLGPRDTVAIVTYAGASGLALPPTDGKNQPAILDAIDRLTAGGSTNGASGIELAYRTARRHFLRDGNNRVILCTDGDFNVGVTSQSELTALIERERKSGVFLSVLGFGTGNLKDATMENLADRGNGNYAYIDTPSEGRKVLVEQMGATLFAIAKDVKIQVEFNPATVAGYRLLGYENRLLAKEDFNDDAKDAGEIGAGHAVTALYEIVPAGQPLPSRVDPLKYQPPAIENRASKIENPSPDLFTVKLRYKSPDGDQSQLIEKAVGPATKDLAEATDDFRFAAAVAAFGLKLRGDRPNAAMSWDAIRRLARESLGEDPGSYRAEFLVLVEKAKQLSPEPGE